ncbi:hypothetical protein AN958_00942 [Leucoagaricus sp. SymC.cos]|nr:hypothetical protein AN958_00942 [Leucoagaricus sp. SymC.cos]
MSSALTPSLNAVSVVAISRRIDRLIYASFVLAWVIFACSMVELGMFSCWLSEVGLAFVSIHHSIVLAHRAKLRKLSLESNSLSKLPVPVSSRISMILFALFTGVVYTAAVGVVITWLFYIMNGFLEVGWHDRYVATFVEVVLLGFQAPLVINIAVWSLKERRAVLGNTGGARWYNLSQYNP